MPTKLLNMFLFLLLLGVLPAMAQPGSMTAAEPRLTLARAVAAALEHNPSQKLAAAGLSESRAGYRLSQSALLPQIGFSEALNRGDNPVYAFGTKLQQQVFSTADFSPPSLNHPQPISDFRTNIGGRWTAFDGFRRQFQIRRAGLLRQSAESSATRTAQETIFRTVGAYESVLIASRQAEVARHAVETSEALYSLARQRVAAGLAVDSDALSAQVNLGQRQQELIQAEGAVRSAWAELEAMMGTTLPFGAEALEQLSEHSLPGSELDAEIAQALNKRPDLESLARQASAQKAAVSSARSDFAPRVDAFGSWQTDRHSFAGSGGSNWMAGAELRVDLMPWQKRAQLEMEKAGLARLEAGQEAARSMVRVEVSRAHFEHESAAKMMEVARNSMSQAAESLRILRNRYQAGLVTVTDVLRAEDADRQSQNGYWQAVYHNALSYAALRLATGTLTADEVKNLQ